MQSRGLLTFVSVSDEMIGYQPASSAADSMQLE